ncbi:MerR family transcriptional regulator [Anaeromicrobium sediminis]|uniref:HTH merR-type domain-containing protein n=1 Tax=Anaeromicrobium sediminis TaxID=1478221 RepID=A0A267MDS5_9FIRM|nr:MerR family transcriptional regulator [Anaeromicrobium sediminis]PAB57552.1 hypothetical protein CCE28_18800 [Anaeromicrobium sediminis]
MNDMFSIGQVAKIHRISIQTLRYYDRIDLLKPEHTDEKTGYRYYTEAQLETLETISYLKLLGMSLKDIKNYLNEGHVKNSKEQLKSHLKLVDEKIEELNYARKKIINKLNIIDKALLIDDFKVHEKYIGERNIIYKPLINGQDFTEFGMAIKDIYEMANEHYLEVKDEVGVTLEYEDVLKGKYESFSGLFLFTQDDDVSDIKKLPKGKYVCSYHRGKYKDTHKTFKKMLDYIKNKGYEVTGKVVEISLIDLLVAKDERNYITEIQIPVK